jgi:type IV pilus assembly protein PilQ
MNIKKRDFAGISGFLLSGFLMLTLIGYSYAAGGAPRQTEITGIQVIDNTIQIQADAPLTYKLYRSEDPFKFTVDIEGAHLGKFTDKIFPDKGGVTEITPVQIRKPATAARLHILLQSPATLTADIKGNVLVLTMKASVEAVDGDPTSISETEVMGEKDDESGAAVQTDGKTYCEGAVKKQSVSFDVQDADLVSVISILNFDMTGCNIVVNPEDVRGKKITMKLSNVPWDQALDIILKTFGLQEIVEGNVIRVVTKNTYQEEQRSAAAMKELIGIETKVFIVNYANVDKIKESIDKAKILTSRGNISTDPRTRSIIVKDIPASLEEIGKLVATLDKPTRQVLIEARMVEVSKNFSNELGVEWGGYWSPTATKSAFDAIGSILPNQSQPPAAVNGSRSVTTNVGGAYFPTLVGLGTTATPTGAFTLGYLNANRTLGLDLRISALEASGNGKMISSPRIMTLDNQKALIKQGTKIPYQSSSANLGTNTQFVDAVLELNVTPQVGPDKSVLLNVVAKKDSPDFSHAAQTNGVPSISTNEATTQVLMKNGETVVIGGILSTTEDDSVDNVPGISKIPILGELFKHNAKTTSSDELLIFITPRVIEQ